MAHPGKKDLVLELSDEGVELSELKTKEQVMRSLNRLRESNGEGGHGEEVAKKCADILRLDFINGTIVESCNQIIQDHCRDQILSDPELAMDLLEVSQASGQAFEFGGLFAK